MICGTTTPWRGYGDPDYFGEGAQTTIGAQAYTPVASMLGPLMSPLGTPCQRPPWGYRSAVDLTTRRLVVAPNGDSA